MATTMALVIVRKRGSDPKAIIDSSNVRAMMPSDVDFEMVQRHFTDFGFSVSDGYAGSFTISGSDELFNELLPELRNDEGGAIPAFSPREVINDAQTEERSTDDATSWLAPVAAHIAAITRSDPITYDEDNHDDDYGEVDL